MPIVKNPRLRQIIIDNLLRSVRRRTTEEIREEVEVQMGKTSCNVPDAAGYIQKMIDHGPVKKKKTAKC